jgi:hypothetical protein
MCDKETPSSGLPLLMTIRNSCFLGPSGEVENGRKWSRSGTLLGGPLIRQIRKRLKLWKVAKELAGKGR